MNSRSDQGIPTDSVVEVELTLRDASYPVVNVSDQLECSVTLLAAVPATGETDSLIEYLSIEDDHVDRIIEAIESCERAINVEILTTRSNETLVRVETANCIIQSIYEANAILATSQIEDGNARGRMYIPPNQNKTAVLESLKESHPNVETSAVRNRPIAPEFLTQQTFRSLLRERLTDRQWDTLHYAYAGGYFERPRRIAQDDIADTMDLSQETISQHLRAAQRRVFSVVFEKTF